MIRKNSITYWVLFLALVGLSSCATTKKVAQKAPEKKVAQDTTHVTADQEREFQYLLIEGLKQKALGNLDKAIPIFSRCLEIDPSSSTAMFELANIHIAKGDFTSAMLLLEKAVANNPENEYYHLMLARVYQQNKQFDKAADQYGQLAILVPGNDDYKYYHASLLAQAGKYEDALKAFDVLQQSTGPLEQIAVAKQQLYLKMGKKKEAFDEIEGLIKTNPKDTRYYGLLADMYLADGDSAKALENYHKILQIEPDNGFVQISLANYYRENGKPDKAYNHLLMAFKNPNLDVDTKIQMYVMIVQKDNRKVTDEQELELLKAMMNANMDDERPRAMYVDYLVQQNKIEKARDQMRIVVGMNKDNIRYWQRLLFLDNNLQDWKAMYTDGDDALKYFPSQPLLYVMKAVGALQMEKYQDVISILDKGQQYVGDNNQLSSQFYMYRAEALYKMKDLKKSYAMFNKVVQLDPTNYTAMNNYAYYLSLRSDSLQLAEKLSGKVVQANPDNATFLDTYAWVLFKKKDYNLAKFYMESAIRNDKDKNAVLLEHYGDILYFMGEKDKALENWKKSVEMGNDSPTLKEKIKKKTYIEENPN